MTIPARDSRMRQVPRFDVLLVDDHAVVRSGYRALLLQAPEIRAVFEAADADAAYVAYKSHRPHVTVMDIMLPGASGIDAARRIRAYDPSARILMFTMHEHPSIVRQALDAGAVGLVTKDASPDTLVSATMAAAEGRRIMSPGAAQNLVFADLRPEARMFERLSPREFEICKLLLEGASIERIAELLTISPKTVSNRLSAARQKLEVESDIALARLAVRAGLLSWLDPGPPD